MAKEIIVQFQRLKKMVLDTSLLNTQHYKVCIKGKEEQFRERSHALPYNLALLKFSCLRFHLCRNVKLGSYESAFSCVTS